MDARQFQLSRINSIFQKFVKLISKDNYKVFIIPGIIACCAIYHAIYWQVFNLNGLQLLSFQNFFNAAILQLTPLFFASFIGLYIGVRVVPSLFEKIYKSAKSLTIKILLKLKVIKNRKIVEIEPIKLPEAETPVINENYPINELIIRFLIICAITLGIIWSLKFKYTPYFYSTAFFMTVYFIIPEKFIFEKTFILPGSRPFWHMLLIYFPINSAAQGITDAMEIKENKKFQYYLEPRKLTAESMEAKYDTIKLIGITDKGFIFSTYDNSRILILNSDSISLSSKNY